MRDPLEVVVLMGPPGTGNSYIGNRLSERGIASYLEIEPLIVEKFGSDLESQAAEVGAYLWRSYRQQLKDAEGVVVFESAGIADRPLHEYFDNTYRTARVLVNADRSLCIDRDVARGPSKNISHTRDRDLLGRPYDWGQATIAPSYDYVLTLDGGDCERAIADLQGLLAVKGSHPNVSPPIKTSPD